MSKEQIIMTLLGLVTAAYALIFKDLRERINNLESLDCDPDTCANRFDKIEKKQEGLDPVLTEIKVKLAKIETILEDLRRNKS